jgi:uncharacterized protein YjiS (DUF1127 family)
VQRLRETQENGRAVGLELQRTGEEHNGIRTTSELGERYAQQLQDIGIVRCTPQ